MFRDLPIWSIKSMGRSSDLIGICIQANYSDYYQLLCKMHKGHRLLSASEMFYVPENNLKKQVSVSYPWNSFIHETIYIFVLFQVVKTAYSYFMTLREFYEWIRNQNHVWPIFYLMKINYSKLDWNFAILRQLKRRRNTIVSSKTISSVVPCYSQ